MLATRARHSALTRRVWRYFTNACYFASDAHELDISFAGSPRLGLCYLPSGLGLGRWYQGEGPSRGAGFLDERLRQISEGSLNPAW
jgi:hypothetical protein